MKRLARLRPLAQVALLLVAAVIVAHGLLGPQLAPRNLSTVLTWVHYRGLLMGVLLLCGNLFCAACPLILVRDLARRLHAPTRRWPRWLGHKPVAVALFIVVLFCYERFDWWAAPAATAWLVVGYFLAAVLVDLVFKGATFCAHVCPVGQFSFLVSTLSPTEVRPREAAVCDRCRTEDCIAGRRAAGARETVVQRGCELGLFLPAKVGNLDCTFCLDCVKACPHDNVMLGWRPPAEELSTDQRRSRIGRLSQRADLAALVTAFTFGAMLNAFAMTAPALTMQQQIAATLGTRSESIVLGVLFVVALVLAPLLLLGAAAWLTTYVTGAEGRVRDQAVRYAFALTPLGTGIWLAHYGFHFLTAVGTIVPVGQNAVLDLTARALFGEPDWRWLGLRPGSVWPLELGALLLGALGSLILVQAISARDHGEHASRAAAIWMVLVLGLMCAALWVLSQPMEMRGLVLGS